MMFSGDAKGLSVHQFLERVLRVARNISYDELFEQSLDLFDGKALLWFRANCNRFRDWKGLTELLVQYYQPLDYPMRLNRLLSSYLKRKYPLVLCS